MRSIKTYYSTQREISRKCEIEYKNTVMQTSSSKIQMQNTITNNNHYYSNLIKQLVFLRN